jgi:hypothetical protein
MFRFMGSGCITWFLFIFVVIPIALHVLLLPGQVAVLIIYGGWNPRDIYGSVYGSLSGSPAAVSIIVDVIFWLVITVLYRLARK